MSAAEAEAYHGPQVRTFAATQADMVAAFTMNYLDEAIGIVAAARKSAMPVAISFTLETDGRLPSGDSLDTAIARTDEATDGYPAYYMINCAHPTHSAMCCEVPTDGPAGSAASARTRRSAAMPSSTSRQSSTSATP